MKMFQKCVKCKCDVSGGKHICNSCFQKSLDEKEATIQLLGQSQSLCIYYNEIRDELQRDLNRAMSRKRRAEAIKKRQRRLVVEWIVLIVLLIVSNIAFLMVMMMMNTYNGVTLAGGIVASLTVILVSKLTRYSGFDLNLRTIPRISYQIDQLDVPDNFTNHLKNQIQKITEILDNSVCA